MAISIVMATYNGEKFIEEQLLSICSQTRKPDEVVICDDGSTDRTVEIITDFIRERNLDNWKLSINPANLKEYPAYVKASLNFIETSKKSNGDIIFFSDQDDIWDSRKIEIMTNLMEENPQIYTLICNRSFIDGNGNLLKPEVVKGYRKYSLSKITMLTFPLKKSIAYGMCMAIRRCILDHFVEINSPHYYYHDYSFGIIASALNGLYFYNEVLASHRRHADNVTVSLNVRRNKEKRIKFYQERIYSILFILDVISYFSNISSFENETSYYSAYLQIWRLRLNNLKSGDLLAILCMFRYVPKYFTLKSYLGDIIYTLGLEKYFK